MALRQNSLQKLVWGLVLSFSMQSAEAWGAPDDVPGWDGARWGMTRPQLEAVLDGRFEVLSGRWLYGGAYAELTVSEVVVGGLTFAAFLQMGNRTDRLRQVLLERRRVGASRWTFN